MPQTKLKVALISCTKAPELTIATAGRLCYSASEIETLQENLEPEKEKFVKQLMSSGHLSPVEHASFTFGIEGVSRALMAQLTRHRIASFSVQSQRYVKAKELNYIIPDSILMLPEAEQQKFRDQMTAIHGFYTYWTEKGIQAEDARFVLPNAAETRIIVTMNARELMHLFSLRCCRRAQWEIRRLAWAMLGIARREAPSLFSASGPNCLKGGCPEGRMSCGKKTETEELSASLTKLLETAPDDKRIIGWVFENIKD